MSNPRLDSCDALRARGVLMDPSGDCPCGKPAGDCGLCVSCNDRHIARACSCGQGHIETVNAEMFKEWRKADARYAGALNRTDEYGRPLHPLDRVVEDWAEDKTRRNDPSDPERWPRSY